MNTIQKHVSSAVNFVISNPTRLKLAIFAVVLAIMIVAALSPAALALAEDATGGSHW